MKLDNPAKQSGFLKPRYWARQPKFHITFWDLNFLTIIAFEALTAITTEVLVLVTRGRLETVQNFRQICHSMKTESICSSEMSDFLPSTRIYNPETSALHCHVHKRLSLYNFMSKVNPFEDLRTCLLKINLL